MAGCASLQNDEGVDTAQLVVQYGTLKLIANSSEVDAPTVLYYVERARSVMDGQGLVTLDDLAAKFTQTDTWARLDDVDRQYLTLLFLQIEDSVIDVSPDMPDRYRVQIEQILTWAAEAARRAEG